MTTEISGTEEAQAVNVALLPCPFCQSASAPKLKRWDMEPAIPGFYVVCDAAGWEGKEGRGCGCSGAYGETEAEAISAWNRRATPSLPQDAAALVEKLEKRAADYRQSGPSAEHSAALYDEAAVCIRSQSAALASAREVIEFYANGFQKQQTRLSVGPAVQWTPTDALLDDRGERAREWKGR